MIDEIAWALPPNSKTQTRPAKLVEQLNEIGKVDPRAKYYFHGRASSAGNSYNAGLLEPKTGGTASQSAVFSPAFGNMSTSPRVWSDFYDDWSIAPDINPLSRLVAARTYRQVRRRRTGFGLVTCNSPYMQAKLQLSVDAVLPNGVDESLGYVAAEGDNQRRLLVLGHFFPGRTDFALLADIAKNGRFDEIVIGSPGSSHEMHRTIAEIAAEVGSAVQVRDWIDLRTTSNLVGPRTVALIPHTVSDYTLSQDLMKIYQYLALGLKVICPRLLWPRHLDIEHALLIDLGVKIDTVREWIDGPAISAEWRADFARTNSWRQRALRLLEMTEGRI